MYTKPSATVPGPTSAPTVTATVEPTTIPSATATLNPATPSPDAITVTPEPVPTTPPTAGPSSAPIYTFSCTFSGLVLNSTSTVITGISGKLTNRYTGDSISGSINPDSYQFDHVAAGYYDLVVDIQYTVYFSNNSTSDRDTRITDSFEINGNFDKTYPLY